MNRQKSSAAPFSQFHLQSNGFTLVELLVVITIIAVLAGVVIAMVGRVKASAQRANAMSSIRQVATFNLAYAAENNGNLNIYRFPGDKYERPNWIRTSFWGRLQPYMFLSATGNDSNIARGIRQGIEGLFNAKKSEPGNSMPKSIFDGINVFSDVSGLPLPFGFNSNLYRFDHWVQATSQPDPSQVAYFTFGSAHFTVTHGNSYAPMPLAGQKATNNIFYLDDRKAPMVFLDGHIEVLAAPIPPRRFGVRPPVPAP